MVQVNRNVIVSHGGKHGKHAKTYLKGQDIPLEASKHVPNEHLTANTPEAFKGGKPAAQAGPAAAPPRPAKSLAEAKTVEMPPPAPAPPEPPKPEAKKEEPPSPPPPEPPTPPVETGTEDEPVVLDEGEEREETPEPVEIELPTSKRQLTVMLKADLQAVAEQLKLDTSGTGNELRARIAEALKL